MWGYFLLKNTGYFDQMIFILEKGRGDDVKWLGRFDLLPLFSLSRLFVL
jgi:hypothetical protein